MMALVMVQYMENNEENSDLLFQLIVGQTFVLSLKYPPKLHLGPEIHFHNKIPAAILYIIIL